MLHSGKDLCLHFVHALRLWEANFKDDELVYLAEEISKQHSIQAVAWVLLATFSQINSEN